MNGPTDRLYVMNDQPGSMTVNHDGLSFHFTLVETNPVIVSTMRTSLPLSMNATRIECIPNTLVTSYTPDNSSFLFFVPSTPQRLVTGDPTPHGNASVNFTVSWDAGEVDDVSYRVTVIPALASLQSVFVTRQTSLQLTFEYSIDYTIQVVASNCVGNSTPATLNINSGCSELSTTGNVIISSYTGRDEGSTVTFHCSNGFVPVGEMMSMCSSGRWLPLDPTQLICQPVDCGVPAPAPMVIIDPYVNTTGGSLITYHCDDGLIPNNTITAICQSDGQWNPSPDRHTCRPPSAAVCGDPAPPPHGSIGLYTSTVEGTILIFMCDEGYSPTGEMTTVCTANGNWEPNPADTECVIREVSGSKHPLPYEAAVSLASVICFISGGVLGMLCSYIILRCKQSHAAKNGQHVVSQPPIPVYEDIHTTSCDKPTIELSENVAYGHTKVH